ncbi:TIGR00269 family protein [Thermomonospora catenispora]|uniref:TIGR00269 family protein n=1 Tax=Thermomonospora catenispora TaxID=2493090 RepID=UPI001123605E|nr:TIGR00269 family protein [Thermomonospora catenispora]TNY36540.1 TIGR00269 family protein [Thermomonospora catenispora]
MKCHRCEEQAAVEVRHVNAAYCPTCFVQRCREQVSHAISKHRMIRSGERVLVAVSGGKDSLAVWDLLLDLGYQADGVYLGLGIGGYSDRSGACARAFAERRGARLIEVDLAEEAGFTIPQAASTRRTPCSACGLSKRHLLNKVTLDHGYDVLVTGHNLDDEAAVLFGNTMQWNLPYLARQRPALPESQGFARRVKPLIRLTERETAAYCVIRRIDYIVEECPMATGNRHLMYKELLNSLEERAPGSKAAFLNGFSDRLMPLLDDLAERERDAVGTCARCGSPTTAEVCAFCRLRDQATRPPRRRRKIRRGNRPARRDEEKPQKAQTEKTGAPEPSVGS